MRSQCWTLVGTSGVFDTALTLAIKLTRGFHCGATVNTKTKASCGLTCIGEDPAKGKNFGRGGPEAKKLGPWDDTGKVGGQLEWARFYHLAPSGVLCEGYGEMDSYARTDWPQLNSYACTAHLVVVSEADYEVKMARALELVMPGRPSVHLRHEMSLTYWLSGNALLQAGVTCPSGSTGPLSTV